ncbi:hypothetical protein [Haloarcula hispanica]|uniref:hypothetical protein n=1 Tax=Haloarcula hispanica TaxID=51589 RepID=UPI0011B7F082|nr:hypothetical protein [Haloarcula hispanica]
MSNFGLTSAEVEELRHSRNKETTPRQERKLAQRRAACRELELKRRMLEEASAQNPSTESTIKEIDSEIKRQQRAILTAERKQLHEKISEVVPDVTIFGVSIVSLVTFKIL